MGIPGCYAGKVLFVDLTKGILTEETLPECIYREFIGGNGLGIRILYERMKARIDPMEPESILGFVVGSLTGTAAPGSGRHMLVAKSPLTGTWAESNSGGSFGPELKTAGYDGVFFSGISPRPVYLLLKNGKAEIREASHLWGKDAYETQDLLHEKLKDDRIKISCIGPSGELLSLLAGVVSERGRMAARNGIGALMGSKRLKAVAVRGGVKKIEAADPDRFKHAMRQFMDMIENNEYAKGLAAEGTGKDISLLVSMGNTPLKNWQLSGIESLPGITNLDGKNMDKYKVGKFGCYACPISCGAIIRQNEGPFAIKDQMHRPEYQTLAALGGMLMNDNLEAVIKANDICNRYGIDTMGVGGTIGMAMECYEKGIINKTDTDGIELTWGNAEAIVAMVEKVARTHRKGSRTICRLRSREKPGLSRSPPVSGARHRQYRRCQPGASHGQPDYGDAGRGSVHRFRSRVEGVQRESVCIVCHRKCLSSIAECVRIVFPLYNCNKTAADCRADCRSRRMGFRLDRSHNRRPQNIDLEAGF
jgi:aldehyde:ferredoxin oxidoreductase